MPEASKAMDHLSSTVQNHTLNLILAVVRTPVAGLEYEKKYTIEQGKEKSVCLILF